MEVVSIFTYLSVLYDVDIEAPSVLVMLCYAMHGDG